MKVTTSTLVEMDDREFEDLVHEHYPNRASYSTVADNEMANGDTIVCQVARLSGDNERESVQDITKWAAGEKVMCFSIDRILEDLLRKGVIPEGKVIIVAWW